MKRAPAHAGRLRGRERALLAVVLVVMAAFVGGLALVAAHGGAGAGQGPKAAASSRSVPIGSGQSGGRPVAGTSAGSGAGGVIGNASIRSGQPKAPPSRHQLRRSGALGRQLTAALQPVAGAGAGTLSVGVIDVRSGAEALYRPSRRYLAPGFARADILAVLIYQHQVTKTPLSSAEAGLAAQMMETGSSSAAASLWQAIGGGSGLRAANRLLGLRHTRSARRARWEQTSTTLPDELRLLADLTSTSSPLALSWRDYELGLMAHVTPRLAWGVSLAASGAAYTVASGAVQDGNLWVIDSFGAVLHDGRELLIATELAGCPARSDGIAALRSAALAAARIIAGSGH